MIKTANLAYADAGFIHHNDDEVYVEILQAGHPAFELTLGSKICLDGACFKKDTFIKKYLNPYYPKDILKSIFLGRPIFNRENIIETKEGFEQKIYDQTRYQINYKVMHDTIRFKDSQSKILIKIKKIP